MQTPPPAIRRAAALVTFVFLTATVFAAPDNRTTGPAIPMPPFHVNDFLSYFGFAWKAVIKDDKIERLRFSRVDRDSLANRAGLIVDDRLVSIDGHSVAGMSVEELQRVFFRDIKPGSALVWQFTIERGALFPKQHVISLQLHTAPIPPESTSTVPAEKNS